MEFNDYYDVLEIRRDAGLQEIKLAYRTLSKKYHPDFNEGDSLSNEKFIEIQEAYKKLLYKYNKNKNRNDPYFNLYYTDLNNAGKNIHSFKRIDNGTTHAFIPPVRKQPFKLVWVAVLAVAALAASYFFYSNKTETIQYTAADTANFNFLVAAEEVKKDELTNSVADSKKEKARPTVQPHQSGNKPKTSNIAATQEVPLNTSHLVSENPAKIKKAVSRRFSALEDFLAIKNHEELVSFFGTGAVRKSVYTYIDGVTTRCSIVELSGDKKLIFVWDDQNNYSQIKYIKTENKLKDLEEKNSKLHSKQGIYTGMTLKELQQLNSKPVYFYGWGLDNGGVLSPGNTGDIDFTNLIIKLSCDNCSLKYYSGEKFSSADATADNQKIVVSSITIPG